MFSYICRGNVNVYNKRGSSEKKNTKKRKISKGQNVKTVKKKKKKLSYIFKKKKKERINKNYIHFYNVTNIQ